MLMVTKQRRPASTPDLGPLVSDLYGALATQLCLEDSLRILAPVFRTCVLGVNCHDYEAGRARYPHVVGAYGPEDLAQVARTYEQRAPLENIWANRSTEAYLRQGYQYGEAVATDSELLASPYYQHYLKAFDVRYGMGVCLAHEDATRFTVLSLNRSPSGGRFDQEDIDKVVALRPHLVNLYALYRRFERRDAEHQSLANAFNRLPIGMLLIRHGGIAVHWNESADSILRANRGIYLGLGGRIILHCRSQQHAFEDAVRTMELNHGLATPRSILVSRLPDDGNGLILHLCSAPVGAFFDESDPVVIGFLYSLDGPGEETAFCQILEAALGLTHSEARVALALRNHKDVDSVAEALHIAVSTVRTHLKHLYEKTNVAKQAALVSVVERIVVSAPREWHA